MISTMAIALTIGIYDISGKPEKVKICVSSKNSITCIVKDRKLLESEAFIDQLSSAISNVRDLGDNK